MDESLVPFFDVSFYIGRHVASQNIVRNVRSTIEADLEFNNIPPYRYSAEIDMWEYTGSLRYSLSTSNVQPFVKGGYGWAWTRLEDVQANGIPFTPATTDWMGPDNIWPTVWHLGAGVELIPWRRFGKFLRGAEGAFRFEYAYLSQDLKLDLSSVPLDRLEFVFNRLGDIPSERVSRHELLFGATVTF